MIRRTCRSCWTRPRNIPLIAQYLTIVEGDDTTTIDTIHEAAAAKMAKGGEAAVW